MSQEPQARFFWGGEGGGGNNVDDIKPIQWKCCYTWECRFDQSIRVHSHCSCGPERVVELKRVVSTDGATPVAQ